MGASDVSAWEWTPKRDGDLLPGTDTLERASNHFAKKCTDHVEFVWICSILFCSHLISPCPTAFPFSLTWKDWDNWVPNGAIGSLEEFIPNSPRPPCMHIWIHRMQVLEKPADSHAVANTGIRNSALQHLGGINLCSGIIMDNCNISFAVSKPMATGKGQASLREAFILRSWYFSTFLNYPSMILTKSQFRAREPERRTWTAFTTLQWSWLPSRWFEGSIREADRSNNSNRWWVGDKDHGLEGQKVVDSSWEVRKPATVGHFSLSEIREKQDSKQQWMKIMKAD